MKRNEFVKNCGLLCAGSALFPFFLEGCVSSSIYSNYILNGNQIVVNKKEFKINSGSQNEDTGKMKPYVLLKSDKLDFPICLYHTNTGDYVALLMMCTHKGCELKPQGYTLVCPCHGSEFSEYGVVQNPPAEEKLKRFKVSEDETNVYIYL